MGEQTVRDAVTIVAGFARTLRAAGVDASPDRLQALVGALGSLDPNSRADVYWAGRLTLCGGRDDLERYDRAFAAYFTGDVPPLRRLPPMMQRRIVPLPTEDRGASDGDEAGERPLVTVGASASEVLRHRDFARLTAGERDEVAVLLARFRLSGETRPSRRGEPAHRGRIDRRRTVRELLRRGGEPARLRRQRPRRHHRRVVLLLDVSGSMTPYATSLLRFAHAAVGRRGRHLPGAAQRPATEVFTIGTRLTRVTDQMAHRDPDTALGAVAEAVPDHGGGTRLGELLKEFLDRWGQRGLARGAVVVVLSDGWERGDPALLGQQMARLSLLAHRIVWANPRKGQTGYEPLAGGMAAALVYVDDFVEGHSLAALERLASVVQAQDQGAQDQGAHDQGAHARRHERIMYA